MLGRIALRKMLELLVKEALAIALEAGLNEADLFANCVYSNLE